MANLKQDDKVIIAEISDNISWNRFFALYAHTWGVVTTNIYTDIINSEFKPELIGLESSLNVLSVSALKKPLTSVATVAEVVANAGTFNYNFDTNLLLVHFEDNKNPYQFGETEIEIGFVFGLYKSSGEIEGEWNSQQYYPRLISTPEIIKEKDDTFFSKQIFRAGKVSFDNSDYRFVKFSVGKGVRKKTGSFVRVLLWVGSLEDGEPDYDDFEVTYQGIVSKIKESNKIDISLKDIRTSLDAKTPTRILDNSNFTDLKKPDKEYNIPQVWGKCYEVPCLCLNENVNKGNKTGPFDDYTFMICDSTLIGYSELDDTTPVEIASNAIKQVFVDGVEIDETPTVSTDATNGIYYFTLDYENFQQLDDDGTPNSRFTLQNKVSITVEGYLDDSSVLITNGLAIIRELLYQAYDYTYDTTFYDTTTWASFETDAYKCGLYVSKPQTIQSQIEEISNSQIGEFVWNENLKFSFNNDDYVSIKYEISKHEFFPSNYIPSVDSNSTQVLAAFRSGMRKRWAERDKEEGYDWIIDNSNKTDALSEFNSTRQKDFETLLYDDTDLTSYQNRIHFFGDISDDRFTIRVPWKYRDLDKGEYIAVEYDLPEQDFIGWVICQTQKVKLDILTWQVEIECRIFEYGPYFSLAVNDDGTIKSVIANKNDTEYDVIVYKNPLE